MKKLLLIMGVVLLHFDSLAQCANANNIYSFTTNGKRYELVKENRNWFSAVTCAVSRGGYLAHIENAAENTALLTELSSQAAGITLSQTLANDGGGGSYIWLGANDIASGNSWVWNGDNSGTSTLFWQGRQNGTSVGGAYQNWGVDFQGQQTEPDNSMMPDALGFALTQWPAIGPSLGSAGMWNDLNFANTLYYLIEFDGGCTETSSTITKSVCDSYTSPSGKTWTITGTYNDTIPNAAGCDSVITVNLTILSSTQSTSVVNSCGAFTSPSGKLWTMSGTYKDTIPNSLGCDSIITINLRVSYSSYIFIDEIRCDSYTSSWSGKTWTTTGTYNDTIPNAAGCDSVITVNLTILSSTQSSSNINTCSAFTSPSGKVWTTSGTYLDTILNSAGCDSIMTFNLTIVSVDNGVTKNKDSLIASSEGSYQWLDCENNFSVISGATNQRYIPSQDGEYAVEVTESGCMDTSECISFVLSSVEGLNDEQIVIYPNPTSDVIQIMMENGEPIDGFSVYDVLGKEYEVKFTKSQNKYEVNLKDLPSGNYVLVIDSQGHQIRRQVQKM